MKKIGIIGGIAPESTIVYYKGIINSFFQMSNGKDYPKIIINSINMTEMLSYLMSNNLADLSEYLLEEIQKLALAGADFGLLASNTPHIVFDRLKKSSPIPLLSIVELACKKVKSENIKRVGLFGTKFTMQNNFYKEVFSRESIEIIAPNEESQNYIHKIYFDELVKGIISKETKMNLLEIIKEMKNSDKIEGLILGGTELSLIFNEKDNENILLYDTTKIHIEGIMEYLRNN